MLGAILLILLADITHIEDLMDQVEWTTLVFFSALFILMQVGWNNREIKLDVTWSYVKRQTAKMTPVI